MIAQAGPKMPNLLIVGAGGSGTTSLFHYLGQHPEIYMSPVKEPRFFGTRGVRPDLRGPLGRAYLRGMITDPEEYRELFTGVTSERAIGEASPTYLPSPLAAADIHRKIPNARIIATLRHPIDRAYSIFMTRRRTGEERCSDIRDAIRDEPRRRRLGSPLVDLVDHGLYHRHLSRYFDRFPRDQIHVILFDDLVRDATSTLQGIFRFLGVDEGFLPDTSTPHHRSGEIASPVLRALWSSSAASRATVRPLIPRAIRDAVGRLVFRTLEKPDLPPQVHAELMPLFREEILRLQDLLQRDLSGWLSRGGDQRASDGSQREFTWHRDTKRERAIVTPREGRSGDHDRGDSQLEQDKERPTASVVIPTYNRPESLSSCLDALSRLRYPRASFEVIVVDDGSAHPVAPAIDPYRQLMDVTVIRIDNSGPARARNVGASVARGDVLAFTDDDCRPDPDWLVRLVERLEHTPNRMIGGRTINALPENIFCSASQLVIEILYAHYNVDPEAARFFATNNLALRTDRFRAIGGFDEGFERASSEDRDLCDRWLHRGLGMTYAPDAIISHAAHLSLRSFCKQHFRYGHDAVRFQQIRRQRCSGGIVPTLDFHRNVRNWLGASFRHARGVRAVKLEALFLLSQTTYAAGVLVGLLSSRSAGRSERRTAGQIVPSARQLAGRAT